MKKLTYLLLALALILISRELDFMLPPPTPTQTALTFVKPKTSNKYTINDRLEEFGSAAQTRLQPHFQKAGIALPPKAISLLVFKDTKRLELYAKDTQAVWKPIRVYPIHAASGNLGPKLKEGDRQVPEGIYQIELLNPNSRFHVSLRLNYPNAFDQEMGQAEGRTQLGSDIMIHGNQVSTGCLAMGDVVAEDLFALAAWVGIENMQVVIAPTDFRRSSQPLMDASLPSWTSTLYAKLRAELSQYQPV